MNTLFNDTMIDGLPRFADEGDAMAMRRLELPEVALGTGIAEENGLQVHRCRDRADAGSIRVEVRCVAKSVADPLSSKADRRVARGRGSRRRDARAERQELTRKALARLGDVDREILILRFIEQWPFVRVAEMLGMDEEAARIRQLRALVHLRDQLDGD